MSLVFFSRFYLFLNGFLCWLISSKHLSKYDLCHWNDKHFFKTTEQLTYFSRSLIEIWYVMSLFGYVNQQQQWTGKELSVSKRSMKIVLWLFTVCVCVCVCPIENMSHRFAIKSLKFGRPTLPLQLSLCLLATWTRLNNLMNSYLHRILTFFIVIWHRRNTICVCVCVTHSNFHAKTNTRNKSKPKCAFNYVCHG